MSKIKIFYKKDKILTYIPLNRNKKFWGINFAYKQDCDEYCNYINKLYNYDDNDNLYITTIPHWNYIDFLPMIVNWSKCKHQSKPIYYFLKEIELEEFNE